MARKAVTIYQVAEHANVSAMTVSNVLSENKARQRHVSEEVRARVLESVRELRYRPNVNAVSLRKRRTNIIGFYAGYGYLNAENAFLAAILGGLQEGCDVHRKDLLLHGTFRGTSVSDIYTEVADGRVDGLVVYAPAADPLVDMLAASSLPVVAITDSVPSLPSVVVDDAMGGRLQADYLAERGHRRVAYLTSPWYPGSVVRRKIAFEERAREHGIVVSEYLTAHSRNERHVKDADLTWLDAPEGVRPTAAVCWNDLAAYDLLECSLRRGVRIPEDLAIVGFDGVISTRGMMRRLTTILAPWMRAGTTAVSVLVGMIEGEQAPPETALPVELFVGDTT